MWDLPGPGLEPVSPALAGGFLTTLPPGKPSPVLLPGMNDIVEVGEHPGKGISRKGHLFQRNSCIPRYKVLENTFLKEVF